MKNYCSNITNKEPAEESVGAWFFGFGSVFVKIQRGVGVALMSEKSLISSILYNGPCVGVFDKPAN